MPILDSSLDPATVFPRVTVILLRPKSPGNVGSVARAMKNMGFSNLVVADPIRFEDPGIFEREARRLAWNAKDLLDRRQVRLTLDAALAPFPFVVGTTSSPTDNALVLTPREIAAEVASRLMESPTATVAMLFGQEDIGLTRESLARCNLLGVAPSSDAYPSLNLSHAVCLFLYELRLALLEDPRSHILPSREHPPEQERVAQFLVRFEHALSEIGFFQGTGKAHMMRELRAIFNRTVLTPRELAIFEGLAHQILWASHRHD